MACQWRSLLLLLDLIATAIAAGQQVCPVVNENVTLADELISFPGDEIICPEIELPSVERTLSAKPSSSLPVPTKLNRPTSISALAVQMKNASHLASMGTDGQNGTNGTFLSFDKWRAAKLKEETDDKRAQASNSWESTESDAIGDELEVELGFLSSTGEGRSAQMFTDAGKHKFNFASLDCAATIVKTNSEASGASSILIDNKDKYLLNPCSAPNKFVVIELCEDILVEEIAIANFEFFSSTFKKVRFSVSDRFPVAKNGWTVLNEFEAENSRNLQKFPIANPQIWARFLLIEILSHHDNEYYCPISLVQVHGKTMMDEFKMDSSPSASPNVIKDEVYQTEGFSEQEEGEEEECNPWPSIDFEHVNVPPKSSDAMKNCTCRLAPLKFEEFLRHLNETSCPAPLKDSMYASTSTTPPATTEESIFKNIMKRLTLLESNTTLSVLYMEEQGKLLSNSFNNLEKLQLSKFDGLVSMFNDTMMDNLIVLRTFANQLKDQSIKILEEQKLSNDEFTTHNSYRVESLEQELKTQRKLVYVASFTSVFTFIYLFLSRESSAIERQHLVTEKRYFREESPHPTRISSLPVSPISLSESPIKSD